MCRNPPMQARNPAGQDARDPFEAPLRRHVRRVRRVGAQRHRALLPEMLTRPWSVVVIRDRSPPARRRRLLDTCAMGFRSRARGRREQPWGLPSDPEIRFQDRERGGSGRVASRASEPRSGWDFPRVATAAALARTRPPFGVIYVSGYTEDTIGDQGIEMAGAAFLSKPFTTDELLSRVRAVLDAPKGE
jgi:DNA-binding NarL/FixJ family response regulator